MSIPTILRASVTSFLFSVVALSLQAQTPDAKIPTEIYPPRWDEMRVGLDVIVDGKPARTIHHHGKTYLPVSLGTEYQLRVWNHGPHRVVAMVSVDGLSVLNGQPASVDHPGYVVAPRSYVVIKGWRKSMDTVAAFSFEEREKSYASLVGRPENIGVIGLIAVEELTFKPRLFAIEKRAADTKAASPPHAEQGFVGGAGTGYGRDVDSRIYYVPFVRSNNRRTVTLYYDTAENLRKVGVPVDRPMPTPFPGDYEFVPPPPRKNGKA